MMTAVRPASSRSVVASTSRSGQRVQPRGGFVEHHQAGVAKEDACERQQLGLAGRQAAATGADDGVEAV